MINWFLQFASWIGELRKQFLFPPHTFISDPSTAVACCPAALSCSVSPTMTDILACSPPGSHLDPYCLPYGKGLPVYLCVHLSTFINEETLSLSASQEPIFKKVLALDFQSCIKFDQTWPTWPETDLQSLHLCHIFTENRSKNSTAISVVS